MTAALLEELKKLDTAERLQLVGDLWDSIAADRETQPIDETTVRELERRWKDHLADPSAALPWADVKRGLRGGNG